jgi:bifunctional non-homologous end joining protein LigD
VRRPEQVWWPDEGVRKRDVVAYYDTVAPVLLPHLRNRPYSLKRYPNGPRGPCFWIKDLPPEAPEWFRTSPQPAKSRGGALVRYPLVNERRSLLWLVDFGCVDHHVWLSRVDKPDRPDVVLFDLDPRGGDVVEAALLLKAALDAFDMDARVATAGCTCSFPSHAPTPSTRRARSREWSAGLFTARDRSSASPSTQR